MYFVPFVPIFFLIYGSKNFYLLCPLQTVRVFIFMFRVFSFYFLKFRSLLWNIIYKLIAFIFIYNFTINRFYYYRSLKYFLISNKLNLLMVVLFYIFLKKWVNFEEEFSIINAIFIILILTDHTMYALFAL